MLCAIIVHMYDNRAAQVKRLHRNLKESALLAARAEQYE